MKRVLAFVLSILFILPLFIPSVALADVQLTSGTVNADGVALRSSASTSSGLITRLSEGTVVKLLEANVNAEWYKVEYAGKTGFVNRLYIDIESSLPSYQLEYTGTVVNCSKDVNVRSKPKKSGSLLGKADKGMELAVTRAYCSGNWHEVLFNGQTGYISAEYLSLSAKVDNRSLSGLTVTGGTLSPRFSPNEYGYILTATANEVTISATANRGVKVSIGNSGKSTETIKINSGNSKTIRISVGGKVRYTIYLVHDVLTIGTWNIKRGFENLVMQGWLIDMELPDILGVQEVYVNPKNQIDNLKSLKTKKMQYTSFASTINYSSGGKYGIGQISRYKPISEEKTELESGEYEDRFVQKVVYEIDGKLVSVYNTHFSYQSAAIRKKQFNKVLSLMDADENSYRILTGDFNAKEAEFYGFKKNYTIVNTSSTRFYDYSYKQIRFNQIDNIIVTKNITVLNARAIPTKYSDHFPLFAFIKLK